MIISFGSNKPDFAERCWETQQAYADRVGVEFNRILIPPQVFPNNLKLSVIQEHGKERVLYLDWDVEVTENADNLFELSDRMVMFPRGGDYAKPTEWGNTGLMLGDYEDFVEMQIHYPRFYALEDPTNYLREENAIHQSALACGIEVRQLEPQGFIHHLGPGKWNGYAPVTN